MLVFITIVKHPDNSQSYEKVWQLLNNTLYSVCSQLDTDFRVVVICDKKQPLFHHRELIEKYTEFVEIDFPSHGEDVLNDFDLLGNLRPHLSNAKWWDKWKDQENFMDENEREYFHIANVVLNMGSKLLLGIVAAKKYTPEYVCFFDADDYVGNDISAYVNSHPGENGWLMTHGYKMYENKVMPFSHQESVCGTGNILSYSLLANYIDLRIDAKSTQNELFEYVDSEFLVTLGKHRLIRSFFSRQGQTLLEFPTRSVIYSVLHNESSEFFRKIYENKMEHASKIIEGKNRKFEPISSALVGYFNILPSNSQRVFCLGFQKTGTSSVEWLLKDMGYQVFSAYKQPDIQFSQMLEAGDLAELRAESELFDAFQDISWFNFYKEFDQWYPGSKFILTIRDTRSWWRSFSHYFRTESYSLFKYIYGYENPIGHEQDLIDRYETHNREVMEYFKDRPDDLLVINVSEKDALQRLSEFLGKETSYTKMPHRNATLNVPHQIRANKIKLKRLFKKISRIKALGN